MRFKETLGISHILKLTDHELRQKIDLALKPFRITSAQYSALSAIEEGENLTNADLARVCFVTPQTMNRIMRTLEKEGLVKKSANPLHGLKFDYVLTKKGDKIICAAHVAVNKIEMGMVNGFSKREIEDLLQNLKSCFKNLTPSP